VVAAVCRELLHTLVSITNTLYVLQIEVLMILTVVVTFFALLLIHVEIPATVVSMVVRLTLLDQD
jgi:hypothetical protein